MVKEALIMPNNRYNGGYNRNYNGNYRNNGYNRNNGYRNNGYNRNFDNRPANDVETISLVKYKKKNILIEDMNGKQFVISGNFPSEFLAEMSRVADKYLEYQKVLKSKNPDPKIFAEMFDMMKDWCLKLINMNVDGVQYTMADINAGFNDLDALIVVYDFIVKRTTAASQTSENLKNGQ